MVNNSTNINCLNKESLNSDGQQFHKYQQNKESLNSDGQQLKYQQNKESLNSEWSTIPQYQQNKESLNSDGWQLLFNFLCFVDIGGIVNHYCSTFKESLNSDGQQFHKYQLSKFCWYWWNCWPFTV